MDLQRRNISGHSLLELVIVLMIVGIMATAAAPIFRQSLIHQRVESAARRLKIDLELVQRHAKSRGTSQTISFDLTTSSYNLPGEADLNRPSETYTVDLRQTPYAVAILTTDLDEPAQIVFDGYGLPDRSATIRIGTASQYLDIVVDGQTGQIRIQ